MGIEKTLRLRWSVKYLRSCEPRITSAWHTCTLVTVCSKLQQNVYWQSLCMELPLSSSVFDLSSQILYKPMQWIKQSHWTCTDRQAWLRGLPFIVRQTAILNFMKIHASKLAPASSCRINNINIISVETGLTCWYIKKVLFMPTRLMIIVLCCQCRYTDAVLLHIKLYFFCNGSPFWNTHPLHFCLIN